MKRILWVGSLNVVLGWMAVSVQAGDVTWRPASSTGRPPAASLGQPVPRGTTASSTSLRDAAVTPVAHSAGQPAPSPSVVRAQNAELTAGVPPPVPPPGAIAPVPNEPYNLGAVSDGTGASPFGFGPCLDKGWFRSDRCFDVFSSPISNPFLFEDPRALTEVRPIFMYQSAPSGNPLYRGGNLEFFGTQARVAFTERWSLVINKMGFLRNDPNLNFPGFETDTGFAELWLGPKYTFWRNENTNTLGAVGLTFQIPSGSGKVFQNTGDLSLVPYLSLGQNFWRTSYGSVNALGTAGYSIATDNQRTDYFFLSAHLDYDIANLHKIYPMVELNWTHFTSNGGRVPLNFEGRDLINFGATNVSGNDNLTIATGLRYKFSECVQAGFAAEWPIISRKDLLDFRLTADLIFRY